MEETNIKLSSVFADMMCKTGRAILHALTRGEANPAVLADLALQWAPEKRDALVPALTGCMRAHHRFLLQELLGMIETLERAMGRLDHEIEERLRPQQATIERLDAITGVSQRVLETLFAEVGWELETFPDAAHLASWVGICPGQPRKRRQAHEWPHAQRQSACQNHPGASRSCGRQDEDVSGGAISTHE
ncbi:MAG TPA: transposase [Ktedonobacteraceae bacterium]